MPQSETDLPQKVTDMPDNVTSRIDGHIAHLALNRPDKRNALDNATLTELGAAIRNADRDPEVRVIVLTGEGPSFCSGYDLTAGEKFEGVDGWRRQFAFENETFWAIWEARVPVVAAVQGHAIGLGCDLAAIATITLAEEAAKFSMPEVRFEMAPSFTILPTIAHAKQSAEFMLTGRSITADAAVTMGLATRVVPDGAGREEALAVAAELVKIPQESLAIAKQQWRTSIEARGLRSSIAMSTELAALCAVHESPEAAEFNAVLAERGARAAFAWRDAHFAGDGS